MQTRKRAKSVMFGKKPEKKEKEAVAEKVSAADTQKISEKAEVVERRTVPEKPKTEELSSTLSDTPPTPVSLETPKEDFVVDGSRASLSEPPTVTADEPAKPEEAEPILSPATPSTDVSEPVVTPVQPVISPEPVQSSPAQELSPTPPPSAFTVQTDDGAPVSNSTIEEKKRFGLYFFIVALLSFVLGLGAMALVSYFGLIKMNVPKLSSNIHIPAMIGSKPTPTVAPTLTVAPTEKPVDLQAYSISVLNGSGISGKAAVVKTSLTTAGFKVTTTGNADNSDYTKTQIAAKKSVDPAFLAKLQDELKKSFAVDSTIATLPAAPSTPNDVTVTLGKSTAQ